MPNIARGRREGGWPRAAPASGRGSTPQTPPLDVVTGAAAGWSFRKLRAAYAGNAVLVQRNDTTTQNVGFSGNDFNASAYNTFISGDGSINGFINKWYDQSGNVNDATGVANKPRIYSHTTDFGTWGASCTGGSTFGATVADAASIQNLWAAGGFVAVVFMIETGASGPLVSKGSTAGWEIFPYLNGSIWQCLLYLKASTTDGFTWISNQISVTPAVHVMTFAWNAATPATVATITLDGVVCGLNSSATPVGTFGNDVGGGMAVWNDTGVLATMTNSFGGAIKELLMFKSIPSAPNQAALVANMKGYYGIP